MGPVSGEYHVIGDVPNTASRIEGLNKLLGTTILASEAVVREQQGLCLRPVDASSLRAGQASWRLWRSSAGSEAVDQATRELCQRFAEALAVFDTRRSRGGR